jgi:CO dehydrogenase nickel-insertion accessory protein CooC1
MESADKWRLDIFGRIPEDQNITDYDASGRPIFDLPDSAPSVVAVAEMLTKLGLY